MVEPSSLGKDDGEMVIAAVPEAGPAAVERTRVSSPDWWPQEISIEELAEMAKVLPNCEPSTMAH